MIIRENDCDILYIHYYTTIRWKKIIKMHSILNKCIHPSINPFVCYSFCTYSATDFTYVHPIVSACVAQLSIHFLVKQESWSDFMQVHTALSARHYCLDLLHFFPCFAYLQCLLLASYIVLKCSMVGKCIALYSVALNSTVVKMNSLFFAFIIFWKISSAM